MRSQKRVLALLAGLALPGCLLASDRINRAPKVVITVPDESIHRGSSASLRATVADDQDQPAAMYVQWVALPAQGGECAFVGDEDYRRGTALHAVDAFTWVPDSLDSTCVCAQVTDRQGAKGRACVALQAVNQAPALVVRDVLGTASGVMRPLYSRIHLTAGGSTDPERDPMRVDWKISYEGTSSAGASVALGVCASAAAMSTTATTPPVENADRCFEAKAPGTYQIQVRIADTVTVGGSPVSSWSEWSTFLVPVSVDTPPCIQRTSPEARAQRILLSRSLDLGGQYESREFQVLGVSDDGEPYPAGEGAKSAKMIWYVYDTTQASPAWVRQTEEGPSFEVSQTRFPKAKPGDTVRVRLEVRDTQVDAAYANWICPQTDDYCCAPELCSAASACLRWTTWTVQFQP